MDGSEVNGYPVNIGEKIQRGVSLFDFDGNGKDDIIFGTDSDNIYMLHDDGSVAENFPFEADDKFRVAPLVIDYNNQLMIIGGSKGGILYAINENAEEIFRFETGSEISASPSIMIQNSQLYILFGTSDGYVYAVNTLGQLLESFPINIEGGIIGSIMVADLNNDNLNEIIIVDDLGFLTILESDNNYYQSTPIEYDFSFFSAPVIDDLENDGDLDIIAGTVNSLFVADIKQEASIGNSWTVFRGNYHRNGAFGFESCGTGDLNQDTIINVIDVVSIINIITGNINSTESDLCYGDVNFDGIVNVQDIILIINIILSY